MLSAALVKQTYILFGRSFCYQGTRAESVLCRNTSQFEMYFFEYLTCFPVPLYPYYKCQGVFCQTFEKNFFIRRKKILLDCFSYGTLAVPFEKVRF